MRVRADIRPVSPRCWLPAREIVERMVAGAKAVHPSGHIAVLERPCPWKDHLYDIEQEQGIRGQILYVLFLDDRENKWRIQAVGVANGSFDSRKALPAPWRGLRWAPFVACWLWGARRSAQVWVNPCAYAGTRRSATSAASRGVSLCTPVGSSAGTTPTRGFCRWPSRLSSSDCRVLIVLIVLMSSSDVEF